MHIADEIETKRAANRVNLSLLDEIFEVRTKLENESNSNEIFDFLPLEESHEDDRVEIT